MDQFGVEAVGRHKNVMPPEGGRNESGVANWTGEHSTKTLREQADRGQKSQGWDWVCVGHGSGHHQAEESKCGIIGCRVCAPSG
jgi:hypothetical protein